MATCQRYPKPPQGAKYGCDKRKRKGLQKNEGTTSAKGWFGGGNLKGGPISHLERLEDNVRPNICHILFF